MKGTRLHTEILHKTFLRPHLLVLRLSTHCWHEVTLHAGYLDPAPLAAWDCHAHGLLAPSCSQDCARLPARYQTDNFNLLDVNMVDRLSALS